MKSQYELEFIFPVTPKLLFNHISTEEGLSKWFADKVYIKNKAISFFWSNNQSDAIILAYKECKFVKFSWQDDLDEKNGCFVEFSIFPTNNNSGTLLKIVDFTDPDEKEENIMLWNSNIEKLKRSMGVSNP
jgi:uncharacterized protein YndB with AHSA1/START domain